MESSTARAAPSGRPARARSPTCCGLAAERYGDRVAVRHKADGEWRDVSYAEVGEIVVGDRPRADRPRHRAGRPRGVLCTHPARVDVRRLRRSRAPARVVVPIYPTNSPEECEWVAGNSEARAIVCEDAEQVAKIRAVRDQLPALETIIVIDPCRATADDAIPLDELRERGRGARRRRARASAPRPSSREEPYTFIYTSGTTGPPKGCVLTHGNYRAVADHVRAATQSSTRATSSTSSSRSRTRSRC